MKENTATTHSRIFSKHPRTNLIEIEQLKSQISLVIDPVISFTFLTFDSLINEVHTTMSNEDTHEDYVQFEVHIRGVATSTFRDYECELYYLMSDFDEACQKVNTFKPNTAWYVIGTYSAHDDRISIYDASTTKIS